MKLKLEEAEFFNDLFKRFIIYCNNELKVLNNLKKISDFLKHTVEKQMVLRNKIYEKMDFFIESFLKEGKLSKKEVEYVKTWKYYVKSKFVLYKHFSNYSVLIDLEKNKVYAILGLIDDLEDMIDSYDLPIIINAVLIPFEDKIVYDGVFSISPIHFGSSLKKSFAQIYQKAKLSNEIITCLPSQNDKSEDERDAETLRFYLKSKKNFEYYFEEIFKLRNKNEALKIIFLQEMAKLNSKQIKKDLKEIGLSKGYFAVINTTVIASGKNEKDLEKNLKEILPQELHKIVYRFNL